MSGVDGAGCRAPRAHEGDSGSYDESSASATGTEDSTGSAPEPPRPWPPGRSPRWAQAAPTGGDGRSAGPPARGCRRPPWCRRPASGSAHRIPPCSSTICRARCRPTPDPGLLLAQRALAGRERFLERLRRDGSVEALAVVGDRDHDAFVQGSSRRAPPGGPRGSTGRRCPAAREPRPRSARRRRRRAGNRRRCPRCGSSGYASFVSSTAWRTSGAEVGLGQVQLERAALELGDRDDLVHDPHQLVQGGLKLQEEVRSARARGRRGSEARRRCPWRR